MAPPIRILHAHSSFDLGGKEARAVRLMNAFGPAAEHVVLSAMPGALSARSRIDPTIKVAFPGDAPELFGKPSLSRYIRLARYMGQFDLVLTYNWGAMDMVAARRLFAPVMRLPPLIHHEDGFNSDEQERQKPARVWFRRMMLGTARRVVVPSRTLEAIALKSWHQSSARVCRIGNGVRLEWDKTNIPGFQKKGLVIGTVAGLRPVKNLSRLIRCFTEAGEAAQLVIVGEGEDRAAIERQIAESNLKDRVHLVGFVPEPQRYLKQFDIFALSSDSEQAPIALMEAMAAGLPIIATDVGDVMEMVAPENRSFIVPQRDEGQFASTLNKLLADPELREALGKANRAKAIREFDEKGMIDAYRLLYEQAIGQPGALLQGVR